MFRNRGYKKQQGNVLIITLFIIVVMGFFAINLSKVERHYHDATTKEQLGTQAWLLAYSANEWALTQLYPINGGSRSSSTQSALVDDPCGVINSSSNAIKDMPMMTLPGCSTPTLICHDRGQLEETHYYQLQSTATCGSGKHLVQRVEDVWIKR